MKFLHLILISLAFAFATAIDVAAQTEAVDPATYAPTWSAGQRNVPFTFHRLTGELFTRSRISISTASSVTIVALSTPADGVSWTPFPNQVCAAIDLCNTSTVDVEYRRNGSGESMLVPAGSSRLVIGITNANQISVRRADTALTVVTIKSEVIQP